MLVYMTYKSDKGGGVVVGGRGVGMKEGEASYKAEPLMKHYVAVTAKKNSMEWAALHCYYYRSATLK